MTKWVQYLTLSGFIVLFGGILFLLDGAWQHYRLYVEGTQWPAIEANISGCNVAGSWHSGGTPGSRSVQGESSYVRCTLKYLANGAERENTINVGSTIFTSPSGKYPASKITAADMHNWISRHPAGSILTIHYDPSNPNIISMAGADSELRTSSPEDRLWFGFFIALAGTALIVIAKILKNRSSISTSSRTANFPLH